jgi:hypothetical protein
VTRLFAHQFLWNNRTLFAGGVFKNADFARGPILAAAVGAVFSIALRGGKDEKG